MKSKEKRLNKVNNITNEEPRNHDDMTFVENYNDVESVKVRKKRKINEKFSFFFDIIDIVIDIVVAIFD